MPYHKKLIAMLLLITFGMSTLHTAPAPVNRQRPLPVEKQKLLDRLIMQFRVNQALINQATRLNLPPEQREKLRAERRQILKKAAIYGLGTALTIALAALGYVVWKRGEQEPYEESPAGRAELQELHKRPREREGTLRGAPPVLDIGEAEEVKKLLKGNNQ